ncbi:MAG: nuclear transport factor 2 family protein [Acidobacteriota bacterium]
MSTTQNRVDELNRWIQEGRILDAMNEFYAEDVVMSENDQPVHEGFAANLERERDFVENTEWHGLELKESVVNGDTAMTRWWMDFTNANYGQRVAFHQVAFQQWRDGKIVEERFYYTPNPVES